MDLFFQIAILILSVVIHEVAHGYAAFFLGDRTAEYQGRLTLNPLVHLELFGSIIVPTLTYLAGGFIIGWAKPVPFNPYNLRSQRWGEAIVAAAGPLANIFIALVFGLALRFLGPSGFLPESFVVISQIVVFINIILAIFNLIPIPPLDGSKILFSILPLRMIELRHTIERYSLFLIIVFIFFLWRLVLPIVFWVFSLITGVV
ncbi:MAG: site-2 protease family protein [Candidatus Zambryskibacteria bacterium CG11_big_fil_rev_8_21_14_0_20_40_24]|uniref:Site-2 protease family protein n=1 Tax=Candidatus Zambryskibacteria bacterium CG11_big_fil_rev_8_21_14_0_20_40_24 TaxID=1975116 RepID=A0A2H0K6A2_9BACT|nr:MAG: site-2 protease family protein [Candidatus Zambryskibacteria bacterium CG11_big_fil_rev_8_21_14_0_20_40_24]